MSSFDVFSLEFVPESLYPLDLHSRVLQIDMV